MDIDISYTPLHKDETRKQRDINRDEDNEVWSKSGIDTGGFWSRWLLWNLPNIKQSLEKIQYIILIK